MAGWLIAVKFIGKSGPTPPLSAEYQKLAIWRQVATFLVNTAVKPGAELKGILHGVPLGDVKPLRWAAPNDDRNVGISIKHNVEAAVGRIWRCGHKILITIVKSAA
jgi:hypothetical protein